MEISMTIIFKLSITLAFIFLYLPTEPPKQD